MTRVLRLGCAVAMAFLLSAFAFASSDDVVRNTTRPSVIHAGIDTWMTPADGTTFTTFSEDPIPAGFFCPGSAPFTGTIAFKGGGLKTVPEGILGQADTIIERLDNAVFNNQGAARTRIQIRALHLVSLQPFETKCGSFDVAMRLAGDQDITEMQINLTDQLGGNYTSVVAVRAKLIFTRADGLTRELTQGVEFAPHIGVWAVRPGISQAPVGDYAKVDVDGDGNAETTVPGPSNFVAGAMQENGVLTKPTAPYVARQLAADCPVPVGGQIPDENCHCDPRYGTGASAWNGNPACINWNTGTCVHLHCRNNPGVLISVQPHEGSGGIGGVGN